MAALASPNIDTVLRESPTTELTSADELTWRLTFTEAVTHVDATDFVVSGTTAALGFSPVELDAESCSVKWDVTLSGGDLAYLNGTVTLDPATFDEDNHDSCESRSGPCIWGCIGSGEAMTHPGPYGTNDNTFIVQNDTSGNPPTVSLSASPNPVDEGATLTVTATLSSALGSDVAIPLTTTRNSSDVDDHGTLASIAIGANATTGTGAVTTYQDSDTDDETFTVALGTLPSQVTAGTPSSVQVTIADDDDAADNRPTVSLSASPNPVDEGATLTVTATLSSALGGDVAIPLTTTRNSSEVEDHGTLASIAISANVTTGTGTIKTNQDDDADDETFTVALGVLPSEVTAGTPDSVQVTITDDDTDGDGDGDNGGSDGDGDGNGDGGDNGNGDGGDNGSDGDGSGDDSNRPPQTNAALAAHTLPAGATVEVDLSDAFADPDGDDLDFAAVSSDETVASATIDGATLTVHPLSRGVAEITVTATDPQGESASLTFAVTVTVAQAAWFVPSASDSLRQGFVRVLNHTDEAGEATMTATDDAGRTFDALTLALGPRQAVSLNSEDLELGNAAKGLAGATGPGTGNWRLAIESAMLDVEALGYLRTADGFVSAMVATAPVDADGGRRAAIFNPASNVDQMSLLRLVNPHGEDVAATVTGVDDAGRSPGSPVRLAVPAGTACTVDAAQLESGNGLACGSRQDGLGDGTGKWRLTVTSEPPLVVLSLLSSAAGHLTNLSGTAVPDPDGVYHAHLFPSAADPLGRQGFVRVVNRSDRRGTVGIAASDDSDIEYEPLALTLDAGKAAHFNSDDLELGNRPKGLAGATGSGTGTWRLALESSDIDFEAHTYLRSTDGFLTAMNASAPQRDGVHRLAFSNPGSNAAQTSVLRLVNRGTRDAEVHVTGTDDSGVRPGTTVYVTVPAGNAVELTAAELESGNADAISSGALGDGAGKWRLRVEANSAIVALSLLSSPTGHLANLSRADDSPPLFIELDHQ